MPLTPGASSSSSKTYAETFEIKRIKKKEAETGEQQAPKITTESAMIQNNEISKTMERTPTMETALQPTRVPQNEMPEQWAISETKIVVAAAAAAAVVAAIVVTAANDHGKELFPQQPEHKIQPAN